MVTFGSGFGFGVSGQGLLSDLLYAPTDLIATVISGTQIDLAWTDNATSDSFIVERSTDGTTWTVAGTPATNSLSDTSLTSGTLYYYRVKSVVGSDSSNWSLVVSDTTL